MHLAGLIIRLIETKFLILLCKYSEELIIGDILTGDVGNFCDA